MRDTSPAQDVRDSVVIERATPPLIIYRDGLLKLSEVCALTRLSETVIYEKMAEGGFPIARQLSTRAVAWRAGEVLDWISARPPALLRPAVKKRAGQ